jgi:hypothetical protein
MRSSPRLLGSRSLDQLLGCQADVLCDLTEESRRDVPTAVKGQGRLATVAVSVLPMRAALAHQLESEAFEKPLDLPWLQHGDRRQLRPPAPCRSR